MGGSAATRGAIDRQTKVQVDAANEAAKRQQAALMQSAKAAADQQAAMAMRNAAEDKAKEAVTAPLDNADVQLEASSPDSIAATRKNKRAAFGRNYSGGVSI